MTSTPERIRPTDTARDSAVTSALSADRLGVPSVLFFVISAAAQLTVVAGVVTTGFAITGVTGIPVSFLIVGVVLAVFSVGYVAMARHVVNAGAFYAYVSQGLGRPLGVGAAYVALLAYNALQVGLYGVIGVACQPLLQKWFHVDPSWYVVALVAWALVALLGVQQIDVNGKVLALLLIGETLFIVIASVANLIHPFAHHVTTSTLSPGNLFKPGVGALLVLAVTGFVGFESSVVFSEESKNPRRTVPLATFAAVAFIAILYAFASWAMTVAAGPSHIVALSQQQSVEVLFNQAAANISPVWADIGHTLFATSVLAAMISFHNTTSRYTFSLGRERVMPVSLGRTSTRSGAPRAGSIVQSAIGLAVIIIYAVAGWNPLVKLFYWGGTSGAVGVLFLLAVTSVAVLVFFAKDQRGENAWRRIIAPGLATVALVIVCYLAIDNLAELLGVGPHAVIVKAVPLIYLGVTVLGVLWGLYLRSRRPETYATIGLGAQSVTADAGESLFAAAPAAEEEIDDMWAPEQ